MYVCIYTYILYVYINIYIYIYIYTYICAVLYCTCNVGLSNSVTAPVNRLRKHPSPPGSEIVCPCLSKKRQKTSENTVKRFPKRTATQNKYRKVTTKRVTNYFSTVSVWGLHGATISMLFSFVGGRRGIYRQAATGWDPHTSVNCWVLWLKNVTMRGPKAMATLVNTTPITMIYEDLWYKITIVTLYSVHGVYQATWNCGGYIV